MPTDTDFAKLDRFIKFMKMTTSPNDGEAIAALRRANAVLREMGRDWEEVLRGKITVIADPFANIPTPPRYNSAPPPAYNPPPRPAAPPYSQPAYRPAASKPRQTRRNKPTKTQSILNNI